MVDKARREVDEYIREVGEEATFEVGIHGLHPDLIKTLGRLKYRTSYGQNVLSHSIEVAKLAGSWRRNLGEDETLARRAGLLHDIGKAIDHEVEGSHVEIRQRTGDEIQGTSSSRERNRFTPWRYRTNFHHSVLVRPLMHYQPHRPGARSETLENYIKRLEKLEEISESYDGVEKSFAIQAGREVRILVKPEQIDDLAAHRLARDIRKKD